MASFILPILDDIKSVMDGITDPYEIRNVYPGSPIYALNEPEIQTLAGSDEFTDPVLEYWWTEASNITGRQNTTRTQAQVYDVTVEGRMGFRMPDLLIADGRNLGEIFAAKCDSIVHAFEQLLNYKLDDSNVRQDTSGTFGVENVMNIRFLSFSIVFSQIEKDVPNA